jgi:hypothetical protein
VIQVFRNSNVDGEVGPPEEGHKKHGISLFKQLSSATLLNFLFPGFFIDDLFSFKKEQQRGS